jgi:cystathionine beta-lyase/cystathionine gamma-synthase
VNTADITSIEKTLTKNTKLIYVETPSNPLLKITDLSSLSKLTKSKGILLAVDNTMSSPCFQRPLDLGADLIIHSTSKYITGHTNVIGGAIVMNDPDLFHKLKFIHKATGGTPGPFDCYLTMLGIKTLALRMKQSTANAQRIAEYLNSHNKISKVYYPGLPEHPQHLLAKHQMSGFGGIVSFEIDGDEGAAMKFLDNLELFALAISFGSVASLVSYPAKMSHKDIPREERVRRGFTDSLIRMSIGIENDSDLIEDIENALSLI